ncbi:MAG: type IV pilus assembly protein PilM [Candidatus Brocadiales bacterium]|nr:type IV pilus assembly protein PilM [Candidatus Brocadiales bacterium]
MKKITIPKSNFSIWSRSTIGLDIGTHSIKVVELQEWHGKRMLGNLGIKEIPITYRGKDKRDITAIAQIVKELFTEMGIKNRDVVLAISGSRVSIKIIKVPQMPESDLREAIKWEMRRQVQFSVEDAVLDYSNLGTVMENGVAKLKLLVAAAQKSAVNEQLAIVKEAGLQPVGIDVAPFALWRAFEGIEKPSEGQNVVLIDIGYKRTSISLVTDNALQFTRDAKIGGNSFTEALLAPITIGDAVVSLEHDEAERLKCKYGIPSWDSSESTEENIPLTQIYVIMRPVLEKLLVELGRSFDFFSSQLHVPKIDRIILSGGGAMMKGLPEFLTQGLRMHVKVANPFQTLTLTLPPAWGREGRGDVDDVRLHEISSCFAVAVGLALTVPERIDLLPEEIRIKRQRIVYGTIFAVFFFILMLVFAALYWNASKQLSALQRDLSAKRSQLSAMVTPATKLPQLRELRERVKREKTLLPKEPFERYPWTEMMKEVSNAVPPKAVLTSLSVDTEVSETLPVGVPASPPAGELVHHSAAGYAHPPNRGAVEEPAIQSRKLMKLNGIIFDKDPDDRIGLNRFIRFMEASPLFTNIKLVSTQDTTEYEQVGKNFEFVCVPLSERKNR